MTKLNANTVSELFLKCLFEDGEDNTSHVIGIGLTMQVGFHPERLKEIAPIVEEMVDELPDDFKEGKGGGGSFLNLCLDKEGNQWADLHQTMEELVMLGNACGIIGFPFPRIFWPCLPGGVPYISVKNKSVPA